MLVRLGFAVAAFLEPEILVVDEVLAVGDAEFQKKAIGKMQDVSRQDGRTVLFVSHNMAAIKTLCTSAVLLDNGMISQRGTPEDIVAKYLQVNNDYITIPIGQRTDRNGSGIIKFDEFDILNNKGIMSSFAVTGEDIYFRIRFKISNQLKTMPVPLEITIRVCDENGNIVTALSSFFTDESPIGIECIREVICYIPNLPLLKGQYSLSLWCATSAEQQDWVENAIKLVVEEGNYFNSSHTWRPLPKRHGRLVIPQKWYGSKKNDIENVLI